MIKHGLNGALRLQDGKAAAREHASRVVDDGVAASRQEVAQDSKQMLLVLDNENALAHVSRRAPRRAPAALAQVHTYAKLHTPRGINGSVAVRHYSLNDDGTLHAIYGAGELSENSVASRVDDPTSALTDHGEHNGSMRLEIADGGFFVDTHEGAVAGDPRSRVIIALQNLD